MESHQVRLRSLRLRCPLYRPRAFPEQHSGISSISEVTSPTSHIASAGIRIGYISGKGQMALASLNWPHKLGIRRASVHHRSSPGACPLVRHHEGFAARREGAERVFDVGEPSAPGDQLSDRSRAGSIADGASIRRPASTRSMSMGLRESPEQVTEPPLGVLVERLPHSISLADDQILLAIQSVHGPKNQAGPLELPFKHGRRSS